MSLSLGEAIVDMFARQDPFDHRRDWLSAVVGWRVSASVYDALTRVAGEFDPKDKSESPLVRWEIVRDPHMPEGHAGPFDKDGTALTIYGRSRGWRLLPRGDQRNAEATTPGAGGDSDA